MHSVVLELFGVAVGATELLRGLTVAHNMELLVLPNFAELPRSSAADDVWWLRGPS